MQSTFCNSWRPKRLHSDTAFHGCAYSSYSIPLITQRFCLLVRLHMCLTCISCSDLTIILHFTNIFLSATESQAKRPGKGYFQPSMSQSAPWTGANQMPDRDRRSRRPTGGAEDMSLCHEIHETLRKLLQQIILIILLTSRLYTLPLLYLWHKLATRDDPWLLAS